MREEWDKQRQGWQRMEMVIWHDELQLSLHQGNTGQALPLINTHAQNSFTNIINPHLSCHG